MSNVLAAQNALGANFEQYRRGDLLRSVPLIMCGHLKMDFFQASIASSFDANPSTTCPMMIVKYSGQAPRPFPHPFHGMSDHEMSGHDP